MYAVIFLLYFINVGGSSGPSPPVVYPSYRTDPGSLHPRTFYLTHQQENQVIRKAVCADLDCPFFTVERDHPYFIQQRNYRESKFLFSSDRKKCNFTQTLDLATSQLTAYRKGSNARQKQYPATLPVLVQIDQFSTLDSSHPWCRLSFSVGFYIPHYWGIPAAPLRGRLKFVQLQENFSVFVHTFSGSVENHLLKQVEIFRDNLEKLQLCYKSIRFYLAVYRTGVPDSQARHEIWLEKC